LFDPVPPDKRSTFAAAAVAEATAGNAMGPTLKVAAKTPAATRRPARTTRLSPPNSARKPPRIHFATTSDPCRRYHQSLKRASPLYVPAHFGIPRTTHNQPATMETPVHHRDAPTTTHDTNTAEYITPDMVDAWVSAVEGEVWERNEHGMPTTIIICGKGLRDIPEWIRHLTSLEALLLSRNQLTRLPDWIVELFNLENLDLDGNQLDNLPEGIGQLKKLKRLNLSRNQLTSFPRSMAELTNLETLYFSNNRFTTLPDWFGCLEQLLSLSMSGNPLTSFPDSFGQLKKLKILDCTDNLLTEYPPAVHHLPKLQSLDMSTRTRRMRMERNPDCL
jgi:hypothetical protein